MSKNPDNLLAELSQIRLLADEVVEQLHLGQQATGLIDASRQFVSDLWAPSGEPLEARLKQALEELGRRTGAYVMSAGRLVDRPGGHCFQTLARWAIDGNMPVVSNQVVDVRTIDMVWMSETMRRGEAVTVDATNASPAIRRMFDEGRAATMLVVPYPRGPEFDTTAAMVSQQPNRVWRAEEEAVLEIVAASIHGLRRIEDLPLPSGFEPS